ncbi:hypothetical protein ACFL54_05095 [Planctomycetota bacterium]
MLASEAFKALCSEIPCFATISNSQTHTAVNKKYKAGYSFIKSWALVFRKDGCLMGRIPICQILWKPHRNKTALLEHFADDFIEKIRFMLSFEHSPQERIDAFKVNEHTAVDFEGLCQDLRKLYFLSETGPLLTDILNSPVCSETYKERASLYRFVNHCNRLFFVDRDETENPPFRETQLKLGEDYFQHYGWGPGNREVIEKVLNMNTFNFPEMVSKYVKQFKQSAKLADAEKRPGWETGIRHLNEKGKQGYKGLKRALSRYKSLFAKKNDKENYLYWQIGQYHAYLGDMEKAYEIFIEIKDMPQYQRNYFQDLINKVIKVIEATKER